jgi:hypothetical protein
MRITNHPILTFPEKEEIKFMFEGEPVKGYKGDTIASALHALGIKTLSYSIKKHRPPGLKARPEPVPLVLGFNRFNHGKISPAFGRPPRCFRTDDGAVGLSAVPGRRRRHYLF